MRTYTIAGNPVKAKRNSLNLNSRLNERHTCSFVAIDPSFSIDIGMEVTVQDNGVIVFAGTIDNMIEQSDNGRVKYLSISCVDFSQLIDKRIVAEAYDDTKAGDIVKDFIEKVFAEEDITAGHIQDGPVISKAVFNYDNGNIAMNYLAEVTGYNWDIDNDKKLNFYDRSSYAAPFELTDTSTNYKNLQVKRTRSYYRNRQYLRAGTDVSEEIVKEKPTPKPDGISRTFVMRLPIAEQPKIYIDSIEVSPADIGVNGLDNDKKYYFSYNSNTITQDNGEPALTDANTLEVTYKGLYPIIVVAENPGQISERQDVEGGSGIHENIIQEQNISTKEAALDFATGKLNMYGLIPRIISFETYEHGLQAGQLINISNTMHDLNGSYLIENLTARDDNGLTLYNITCLDGSTLGGWEKLFKGLMQGNKKLVIRENEVLVKLTSMYDTFKALRMTDEMTYKLHQYLVCSTSTICSEELII